MLILNLRGVNRSFSGSVEWIAVFCCNMVDNKEVRRQEHTATNVDKYRINAHDKRGRALDQSQSGVSLNTASCMNLHPNG